MIILLKNKHTIKIDDFIFKCSVGKNGISKFKKEGDLKTPKGTFQIENLYYRNDREKKPITNLKCIEIKKDMGWCDDVVSQKYYNKIINIKSKLHHEKLFRKDHKYDFFIPIKYNYKKIIQGKGSCIFMHLTKNYKPTAGCIALKRKDFMIMLKLINRKTKIKIL
jgi:L,D-peptidoglycan transpeptidase YkuD (ErfK/YbiS/YcfS/YnhG family)